ncbi:MAG: DUF21 domain-containing protein [Euzebyales bacterium]|nr:DUF21 domain-containing protein [Euzebyales bacterium]
MSERWRCCASCRSCCRAPQLGITATSLIVGCIAEPTLGRAFAPLLGAVGLGETAARGVTLTVGFVLATVGQMVLGELGPKKLALEEPERFALALARSTDRPLARRAGYPSAAVTSMTPICAASRSATRRRRRPRAAATRSARSNVGETPPSSMPCTSPPVIPMRLPSVIRDMPTEVRRR